MVGKSLIIWLIYGMNIKTKKLDRSGKEIKCGDRVLVTVGLGFQAAGNVIIKDGGMLIEWDDGAPIGCHSNLLYDYGEVTLKIIDKNETDISFHEVIPKKSDEEKTRKNQ